jgi:hypothetical protein
LYHGGSGRFDGAPSVELIVAALKSDAALGTKEAPRAAGWKSSLATLPAVMAAMLPVGFCPACWPAYAGLLSTVGLGFLLDAMYLIPLIAVLLALAVAALAIGARSRRGYGPFMLGVAASAVVLVGKFVYQSDGAMYLGVAILVMASTWNAWPVGQKGTGCPACSREYS